MHCWVPWVLTGRDGRAARVWSDAGDLRTCSGLAQGSDRYFSTSDTTPWSCAWIGATGSTSAWRCHRSPSPVHLRRRWQIHHHGQHDPLRTMQSAVAVLSVRAGRSMAMRVRVVPCRGGELVRLPVNRVLLLVRPRDLVTLVGHRLVADGDGPRGVSARDGPELLQHVRVALDGGHVQLEVRGRSL